jgi:hypothetical protein
LCYKGYVNESAKRKRVTSRVIRPGDPLPDSHFWDGATPEERINAVWELTLALPELAIK